MSSGSWTVFGRIEREFSGNGLKEVGIEVKFKNCN